MKNDRRYIESSFPVREISKHSAREKSIRHGHISTLHIWWARRPLTSSRASCYSSLIPSPMSTEETSKTNQFIIDLSRWENSLNSRLLELARKQILENNENIPPRILDPFAGGGSIPLEALRLGCETYSSDLNPVAVIIQKCTLEYPQKYGTLAQKKSTISNENPLLEAVKDWGESILEEIKEEIGEFYPKESEDLTTDGYLWAKTIPCQNPSCQYMIPLMRQFWLARKKTRKIALYPDIRNNEIHFKIVGEEYSVTPDDFDPSKGTVKGAVVTCPICKSTIDAKTTRKLFSEGQSSKRLIVVISRSKSVKGKIYRIASIDDIDVFVKAEKRLQSLSKKLSADWGLSAIPDEIIHTPDNKEYKPGQLLYNFLAILLYGMTSWGDLYNARQKLSLLAFVQKIRESYERMIDEGYDPDYAKAITTYLGLMLDRLADKNSILVMYNVTGEKIQHVFGRGALPMIWDYVELNPFTKVGWPDMIDWIIRNIRHLSAVSDKPAIVSQASATSLPYDNEYFDAIFTDPPYYDNVPYSDLSDFFYVWLKRSIGHLHPDLFSTPLTPKSNEIIAELPLLRGMRKEDAVKKIPSIKTSDRFEDLLGKAFQEFYRVLKPNGIAIIVYAHKSTKGWETLVNSLLDSGLVISAAWPINTEMQTRLRAMESATLASSIYIVTRKMKQKDIGIYKSVRQNLSSHMEERLKKLWNEGIGGADFFIAAIGSAIEVFGQYEKVIDFEGNIIRADTLLTDVQEFATNFAINQILHNGFSEQISPITRFYILYRWNYKTSKVQFDESRKLAQSCGIDLSKLWSDSSFVRKTKQFIQVLGPMERKISHVKDSRLLIDTLHYVLLLWDKGNNEQISKILAERNLENSEMFWRVAQAISETLPTQNKEKKLLDGFLAGRTRYQSEDRYDQETLE